MPDGKFPHERAGGTALHAREYGRHECVAGCFDAHDGRQRGHDFGTSPSFVSHKLCCCCIDQRCIHQCCCIYQCCIHQCCCIHDGGGRDDRSGPDGADDIERPGREPTAPATPGGGDRATVEASGPLEPFVADRGDGQAWWLILEMVTYSVAGLVCVHRRVDYSHSRACHCHTFRARPFSIA